MPKKIPYVRTRQSPFRSLDKPSIPGKTKQKAVKPTKEECGKFLHGLLSPTKFVAREFQMLGVFVGWDVYRKYQGVFTLGIPLTSWAPSLRVWNGLSFITKFREDEEVVDLAAMLANKIRSNFKIDAPIVSAINNMGGPQ